MSFSLINVLDKMNEYSEIISDIVWFDGNSQQVEDSIGSFMYRNSTCYN